MFVMGGHVGSPWEILVLCVCLWVTIVTIISCIRCIIRKRCAKDRAMKIVAKDDSDNIVASVDIGTPKLSPERKHK